MAWTHSVRGKLYDLSKFNHPGGPVALELAKGRDADDLIRSYHPFSEAKVRSILAKYEVNGKFILIPFFVVTDFFLRGISISRGEYIRHRRHCFLKGAERKNL